jgi:integrase
MPVAMAGGRVLHPDALVRAADRRNPCSADWSGRPRGAGHIDILWSNGHRSRRLPLTDQVIGILDTCDRTSRAHFASRRTFFVSATGNQVSTATVGKIFGRIWDQAGLPRPVAGQQPRPYDFRHHFAYANIHRWMTAGDDV